MARSNRLQVPDGTYHVTTRFVNREFWLEDPKLKDRFVEDLYCVARFSGVDLLSWTVMDNHLHLHVNVPCVPREYWLDPEVEPAAYAYGMRPPATRPPLWSAGAAAAGDGPRPPVGFALGDGEMLDRLTSLYGPERARALAGHWARLRAEGDAASVEAAKEGYCRRMYNLAQFMKTLKERLARSVKAYLLEKTGRAHAGHVFEDRFHSGLVQESCANPLVELYIDYNPVRAGIVANAESYRWSSLGQAVNGGTHASECRAAYERIWGCPWEEALAKIRAEFAEEAPEDLEERLAENGVRLPGRKGRGGRAAGDGAEAAGGSVSKDRGATGDGAEAPAEAAAAEPLRLKFGHLAKMSSRRMNGPFIGRDAGFAAACAAKVGARFPHGSARTLAWFADNVAWSSVKTA